MASIFFLLFLNLIDSCFWSSRCFYDAAPWSQRHWWRGPWVICSVSRVSRVTSSMLTTRGCWPAGLSILSQQPLSVATLRRVGYCLTRETHEGGNMAPGPPYRNRTHFPITLCLLFQSVTSWIFHCCVCAGSPSSWKSMGVSVLSGKSAASPSPEGWGGG